MNTDIWLVDKLIILTGKNCVWLILFQNLLKWRLDCFWPFPYVYTINYVLYIPLSRIKEWVHNWKRWFIKWTENERLLLSACFRVKFTLKNVYFQRFHYKAHRKNIRSSKKRCQGFLKQASVWEIGMFLWDNHHWKFWTFLILSL